MPPASCSISIPAANPKGSALVEIKASSTPSATKHNSSDPHTKILTPLAFMFRFSMIRVAIFVSL